MKKKAIVTNTVAEILGRDNESLVNDLLEEFRFGSELKDFIMTVKIGKVTYEIWKSSKNDGKFDVVKLNNDPKERMTKEEILEKVLLKAFFNDEECEKISKKLNENK